MSSVDRVRVRTRTAAVAARTMSPPAIVNAINTFEGRKFDYTPRNIVEQNYARYSTDQV